MAVALLGGSGAASAQLVINEIDYDQPSTDDAEFIEIYNESGGAVGLDTWSIELTDGTGAVQATIDLPDVSLADGAYYVVCGDAANVESCDLDVTPDTDLLSDTTAGVRLLETASVIDSLSYEGDVSGATEGTGGAGTDTSGTGFLSLSRVPDGADSDENDDDFALVCVTPGAANTAVAASCNDPLQCGDGGADGGEACDDGGANGTTECGCDATCHFPLAATACGDTATDTACDAPDSCDGAGTCDDNLAGAGDPCGDTATDTACDAADTCDGAGVCEDNLADVGDPCGDQATDTACDAADACNGSGTCLDNLAEAGDPCGDSTDDACHDPDECDGSGACEDNDPSEGASCSDGDFCDGDETCQGGTCTAGDAPCDDDEVCNEDEDSCLLECGDGDLDDGESCDDGDEDDGDGCDEDCQIEDGWECDDGEPSECVETPDPVTCGDGALDDGEACDDGNDERDDGCYRCKVKVGFVCDDSEPTECLPLDDDGGCGCGTGGGSMGGLLAPLMLVLLSCGFRRRRRGTSCTCCRCRTGTDRCGPPSAGRAPPASV